MKDETRHGQGAIPSLAQRDKFLAARSWCEMFIGSLLLSNCAFPPRLAPVRSIIVSGEDPCLVGQGEYFLDRALETRRAPTRKVGTRRAAVRHEERIVYERGIADQIGD